MKPPWLPPITPIRAGSRLTGRAGGYSIGALPPGDYHITFELAGMNNVIDLRVIRRANTL